VPGPQGSINWFLDNEFLYSVGANALNKTGGIIPEEPMYLLLNTAMSSTWGFPMPCPEGCPCDCFDCRKEECQCALPNNMIDIFPSNFLIDWVRVYQAVG
jgi:beta-glucan synthesis-associated protein KRE6